MTDRRLRDISGEACYMLTAVIAVLFMTERLVYPVMAVLSSVLCYILVRTRGRIRCPRIITILLCYGSLVLLQMQLVPSTYFSLRIAFRELSRLCIYVIVVLVAANTGIRENRFLRLWKLMFVLSMIMAICQFAAIVPIRRMLVSVYGDSVSWEVSEYSRLDISRAGSVFVNANMYAQFILLFLAISLAIDQNKRDNVAYALMSWTLIATSLLLAGSRTGTVIAALLVVSSMVRRVLTTRGKARKTSLLPLVILSVTAAVGSVVYLSARQADSARFRAFQVTAGVDNSLAYKVNTFHNMVGRFNALNACVGMGVMETDTKYITKIDFDLGYLIVFYGTAGCILYMCMLYDICCYRNNMPARYVYLNRLITFIFVASGITAGVFFNLRVFSIVAAVVYADVLDAEFQPIRVPCLNGTSPRSGSRQRLYGTRTFGEM